LASRGIVRFWPLIRPTAHRTIGVPNRVAVRLMFNRAGGNDGQGNESRQSRTKKAEIEEAFIRSGGICVVAQIDVGAARPS